MYKILRNYLVIALCSVLIVTTLILYRGRGEAPAEVKGTEDILKEEDKGPTEEKIADNISEEEDEGPLRAWVDLPNSYPWRHCLQEYNGVVTVVPCKQEDPNQEFSQEILGESKDGQFRLRFGESHCVEPSEDATLVVRHCGEGRWTWTEGGHLEWSSPGDSAEFASCTKCLTPIAAYKVVEMAICRQLDERQQVEFGRFGVEGLTPLDPDVWRERQDHLRMEELSKFKEEVTTTLKQIADEENTYLGLKSVGNRRAVIFYIDNNQASLSYLRWWIYTWSFVGLATAEQAFDIVLLVVPAMVEAIKNSSFKFDIKCEEYSPEFSPIFTGPGRCVFKQYNGLSHRDSTIDHYMNSVDCNSGPGTEFLQDYKLLLKADVDTFPTPRLLDMWPDQVIVNRFYGTTFGLASVENLLRDTACAAGIEHRGWFNFGSSWYGDTRRVRAMARLTVSLYKFAKVFMFGPGTLCRCLNCTEVRPECTWGGGPYAPVMSLYLQELALNRLWTQKEWDEQTYALLDQGTTDTAVSICQPALLHAMHNDEPFGKFHFLAGNYKDYDMADLNLTNIRDFSMFMALDSADQGLNRQTAIDRFNTILDGRNLTEYCKSY